MAFNCGESGWTEFTVTNEERSTGYLPFNPSTHFIELQFNRLENPSTEFCRFHLTLALETSSGNTAVLKFMKESENQVVRFNKAGGRYCDDDKVWSKEDGVITGNFKIDVTKDYLLEETTHEKYGDFSNCTAESHMNDWNNVILSGNITKMSLKIGRQEGDVESTLSARYQFVKKQPIIEENNTAQKRVSDISDTSFSAATPVLAGSCLAAASLLSQLI
ncbi:hypothetical protein ACHWQZ_G001344 [Mnemiopsis leidyi]